ncbi:hypothetical protein FY034_12915 [Trichlorobacter lovleyi]|uniref:phage tail tube protein n=1 Tax=Trichlorobacter lovleyi TaxID=313985 RepID=UPI002240340F|nr:phage tail tube protein [Trichlorobacter lovleyi]QOX79793.1 hypothetical protein FY034_12915 [Trichlorobacter lovleyi]
MPGSVAGVEIQYAAKKAATWLTPVACGALNGFLSRPVTINDKSDVDIDDSLGTYFSPDGTAGDITCDGAIPPYLRYAGQELLLALVCGTAGVPTTHAGGTLSKDWVYKPAKNIDGLFATFVRNMKNYIAEVPSLKIYGFTIKGETGGSLELSLDTIGSNTNRNTTTGTNTLTTANNITIAETGNRVRFSHGVFRMNVQSGAALGVGDKIVPSAFEFSFKRKLKGVFGAYTTGTTTPRGVVDEPTNDDMPEISLKLTFPRHTSATMLTAWGDDVRYKMDATFTGPIIELAIPYLFLMQWPHLQIKNVEAIDAKGIIQEPLEFICHGAATAPTGMTGITEPFRLSGTNKFATDPLA